MVSAAVLGLLAAAAEHRPVVCLIDDAQWLDRPSADTLVFAARRLAADRVAILFGAREGEARRFEAPGVDSLTVAPLDDVPLRRSSPNVDGPRPRPCAPDCSPRPMAIRSP